VPIQSRLCKPPLPVWRVKTRSVPGCAPDCPDTRDLKEPGNRLPARLRLLRIRAIRRVSNPAIDRLNGLAVTSYPVPGYPRLAARIRGIASHTVWYTIVWLLDRFTAGWIVLPARVSRRMRSKARTRNRVNDPVKPFNKGSINHYTLYL